jgi:hypothetical protein
VRVGALALIKTNAVFLQDSSKLFLECHLAMMDFLVGNVGDD